MSATLRPWASEENYGFVNGPDGERICQFWGKDEEDFPKARENSQLIVRAVNAFGALLAIAKAVDADSVAFERAAMARLDREYPGWREWTV